ncbi:MAG: SdpI family protein [Lachnospiraceae bacterium]|nr:SdpI family protein [Lachnospiraceae bacterium]
MMEKHRKTFILTCILILLPILAGILLWDRLPDSMPTHFDSDGTPNGWSSKPFAVLGLPLFILSAHVICIAFTSHDPKYQNTGQKIFKIILWICPVVSILCCATIYASALGYDLDISRYMMIILSLMFIILGNYMPKCRQNYTIGIKLPWTLNDEENWNHTHRMAGYLWVICGILMLINAFVYMEWLMVALFLIMILVPVLYSFIYYLKNGQRKEV